MPIRFNNQIAYHHKSRAIITPVQDPRLFMQKSSPPAVLWPSDQIAAANVYLRMGYPLRDALRLSREEVLHAVHPNIMA